MLAPVLEPKEVCADRDVVRFESDALAERVSGLHGLGEHSELDRRDGIARPRIARCERHESFPAPGDPHEPGGARSSGIAPPTSFEPSVNGRTTSASPYGSSEWTLQGRRRRRREREHERWIRASARARILVASDEHAEADHPLPGRHAGRPDRALEERARDRRAVEPERSEHVAGVGRHSRPDERDDPGRPIHADVDRRILHERCARRRLPARRSERHAPGGRRGTATRRGPREPGAELRAALRNEQLHALELRDALELRGEHPARHGARCGLAVDARCRTGERRGRQLRWLARRHRRGGRRGRGGCGRHLGRGRRRRRARGRFRPFGGAAPHKCGGETGGERDPARRQTRGFHS